MEPDLVTILTTDKQIEQLKAKIPELAYEKIERYVKEFGLDVYDAKILVKYKRVARFFEESVKGTRAFKTCANFIISLIFSKLQNEQQKEEFKIKVSFFEMNKLLLLLESGKIRNNVAKRALDEMLETGKMVDEILSAEDLKGLSDEELLKICKESVLSSEQAVTDFIKGKTKAAKSIVGMVCALTLKN